ncbi:MAG: hypothetical protein KTR33_08945 [Gammaproteobacteria bacterium]|nr:hypothetical protein [Gammaproteobacteria bacterium]
MNKKLVQEITECLPQGKTPFPYFRYRYAAMLLPWLVPDGTAIAELKKRPVGKLLEKPPTRQALEQCGDGRFSAAGCHLAWAEPHEDFLLTLSEWSGERGYSQLSRSGSNLVLQVNMNQSLLHLFEKLVTDDYHWRFYNFGHPILRQRQDGMVRQTLGWIRIDLDLQSDEALIEEVQSDWLRAANKCVRLYQSMALRYNLRAEARHLLSYSEYVINRFAKIWDEALLAAALWFIREEIGIRTVWYHTFESGGVLKRIKYQQPPRSLYVDLPRKFCFERTAEHPQFLLHERSYRRTLARQKNIHWHRLVLNQACY